MEDYGNRRAIAHLVFMFLSGLGMIAGLLLANSGVEHITESIEALGDSDYLAGSSEQFGLALYSLVGGGIITGFFTAILVGVVISTIKETTDYRPRRPLRNR